MSFLLNIMMFNILLIFGILILTTNPVKSSQNLGLQCNDISEDERIDCNPDSPNETVCKSRGCCWSETVWKKISNNLTFGAPFCYFPKDYSGYKVIEITNNQNNIKVLISRETNSGFINDIKSVKIEINLINDKLIRMKFLDATSPRYEVPIPVLNINQKPKVDPKETLYDVNVLYNGLITISRKSTRKVIFKTDLTKLTYSDQYLQMTSTLPSDYIYGIGEHKDVFRKKATWNRYTMFAFDIGPVPNIHLYGVHPFYLTVEDDIGNSNGVFMFNSNAMDILLQPMPAITWRAIGGIFDVFIFVDLDPQQVVRQYVNMIGLPPMPPYWSLGFHLCRWGYNNITNTMATLQRNLDANIPIDVQWIDIDAMDNGNDFTYDPINFKGLPQFVDQLHSDGRHYVSMFDVGVGGGEPPGTYPPYDDGLKADIFIKNASGLILRADVWNKYGTVYPDFTNPKTISYWTQQYQRFHEIVSFDGVWNDMNEPSDFDEGSKDGCPQSRFEDPQYLPGLDIKLRTKTICMTAKQYAGIHYNVHSLTGFAQTIASNHALKSVLNKRPFIISRSTFSGQGHYGGHWSGDISSTWESMKNTIPSILDFNIFGTPLMGADICGFNGDTTIELCARWSALGAFYPFSRNHNAIGNKDQDPAALGPIVVAAAQNSLTIRYQLLPYLYTLFYKANQLGDTVFRPLFFEFVRDMTSYTIETQFMWGSALMIIPTLEQGANQVKGYVPSGIWFDFIRLTPIISEGEYFIYNSSLTDPPIVLIRGGHIIPCQQPMPTTTESRNTNFSLIVALNETKEAFGELYWDDGDSIQDKLIQYNLLKFYVQNRTLIMNKEKYEYKTSMVLNQISILGVDRKPVNVKINGNIIRFEYIENIKKLGLFNIAIDLSTKLEVVWD